MPLPSIPKRLGGVGVTAIVHLLIGTVKLFMVVEVILSYYVSEELIRLSAIFN